MASVEARIKALAEEIRRRQLEQDLPIDELSRSLFGFEAEMLGLDEAGWALFLAEMNSPGDEDEALNLTAEDLEKWVSDIREAQKRNIIF